MNLYALLALNNFINTINLVFTNNLLNFIGTLKFFKNIATKKESNYLKHVKSKIHYIEIIYVYIMEYKNNVNERINFENDIFSYLENQNQILHLYNIEMNLSAVVLIGESGCYKNAILLQMFCLIKMKNKYKIKKKIQFENQI